MANLHMSADKELFLDILTKEEREALLTKKMEEIRKKNEALRKRHEEIEADKRQAEKMVKPGSPKKDIIKSVEFNTGKKEEFHRHSGSDFDYLRSRTDFEMSPTVDSLVLADVKFQKKPPFDGEVKRRQKTSGRGKGPGGRGKERPKSLDENGGLHPEPPFRGRRSLHATIPGGGGGHRLERVATMPDQEMNEIHIQITGNVPEHRSSFANSRQTRDKHRDRERERPADVNGPPPDPAYNFLADKRREGPAQGDRDSGGGGGGGGSSGRGGKGGGGGIGGSGTIEDTTRDSGRQKDHRRHPKNYGGTDFQNVKTKMKIAREKQQGFPGSSPQSKMEMTISMTGRERRQYIEWKAERERVDKERIERQKSASGEWRREWDAEKIPQDFEEGSSVKRTEPNRRPAGRIGSGRFDRGERDDRQRGEAPGSKENAELKRSKVGEKIEKSKKPLGRGRGRGRGISAAPRNRILPPNLANDSRKVECTRDLLVVKIDNSPGIGDDVEVEYSDTDAIAEKSAGNNGGSGGASAGAGLSSSVGGGGGIPIPLTQGISHPSSASTASSYSKSCPTHSSSAPAEKMWGTIQENSWDHSQASRQNGEHHNHHHHQHPHPHHEDEDEDVLLEDEYIEDGELYEGMYEDAENDPQYALIQGVAEGDEWEECAEDEEYYVDGNDLVYDDVDKSLRVECQLNPEAPAFVPTSPELVKSSSDDSDNPKWNAEKIPKNAKNSEGDNNNDDDDDNNNNNKRKNDDDNNKNNNKVDHDDDDDDDNPDDEETPKDHIDNCRSSSSKLPSSTIVDEKEKVHDAKAAEAAQSSSSTSTSSNNQGGPEVKSSVPLALEVETKDDRRDEANDSSPITAGSNNSQPNKIEPSSKDESDSSPITAGSDTSQPNKIVSTSKDKPNDSSPITAGSDTSQPNKIVSTSKDEPNDSSPITAGSDTSQPNKIESSSKEEANDSSPITTGSDNSQPNKIVSPSKDESGSSRITAGSNDSQPNKIVSPSASEDEDEEFKDTKEDMDEIHFNDNDNNSMNENDSTTTTTSVSNNNNNNNNNSDDDLSTNSKSKNSSIDFVEENKTLNNNPDKSPAKQSTDISSAGKISANVKSNSYSTNDMRSVTVLETIQTVKDAGAWKLSVQDDTESVLLYKNNQNSGAGDSEGSPNKSLAKELKDAEFGKAQTMKTSPFSSTSSSFNQSDTCDQDSGTLNTDPPGKSTGSQESNTEADKTKCPVSDLSNAGSNKVGTSV